MKIWFDITNTPQVHFLLSILKGLRENGFSDFKISARDFSETTSLLKQKTELPFTTIGKHQGKNLSKKAFGLINRYIEVHKKVTDFDISLSCGSESAIWSSFLKGKKSIAYGDNDLARQWTYGFFVDNALFPRSIPKSILNRQGLTKKKLYQYNGFKEHVYIADFVPDNNFLKSIPFQTYVVVRPENIQSNYAQGETSGSITPSLLKKLENSGTNILFLPRYKSDKSYAEGIKNIYIPENPINGLDACYFSSGVFTGAGTFAREAACLGVPSFSFFLGKQLLAVDKDLVSQNKMYYSRDPEKLIEKYISSDRKEPDLKKAHAVKDEVVSKTIEFISR
ncbi:MAG: DUF354 domain-containing protein [Bacteroidales bacterium]|jgi:predicted glycosyltransferase|nr:DUF354 domain-containing protein [Bacteroidales bacterium]